MDCNTARLLLELARPGELDEGEAGALEGHLAGCPECGGRAAAGRTFDQGVRSAMLAVQTPPGLRDRLLEGLRADRVPWHRHRVRRAVPWMGAAAAALLALAGGWLWYARPVEVEPAEVWRSVAFDRPGRAQVEEALRRMGADVVAPNLDYAFLTTYGLAELPGKPGRVVPQLVFRSDTRCAVVFVLDTRRFKIADFEPPSGAPYKMELLHRAGDRFAYLVFHNGENLDWLKPVGPEAT
jgi:hypothetical protein